MVFGNLSTGYWLGAAASAGLHWQELGRKTLTVAGDNIDVNNITWNLQVGAEVSANRFKLTSPSSPPYAQIAKELDSTVDGDFCLRFRIKWHSGDSYAYFGLTDEEPSSTSDSTMDSCMAGFYFTANSNRGMRANAVAAASYAVDPIASTGVAQTGVANTDYYIELSRDVSANTLTLKKYTSSDYTGTPETHTQTSTPSGINGLKYLKAVYSHDGATGGASAHVLFDQIRLYKDTTTATGTVFYEELLSGLTSKPYMMVLGHTLNSGSTNIFSRNNGDSGSNYAENGSINGGTNYTQTSQAQLDLSGGGESKPMFVVQNIMNVSDQEKLIINHTNNCATGATNAPNRIELAGKWANTSASISSISFNNTSSGSYDTGSEVVVLGYDPDDTEGGSVWEELADVTLGSAGDTITTSTFTAKKYLMVQTNCIASGGDIRTQVVFNNDTGSNYAFRSSHNGGSDSTDTSQASLKWTNTSGSDSQELHTMFIVNVAAKEKLVISDGIIQATAGAGNVPGRRENVGKWINTSNQITRVDITNGGAGDFDTGSSIKVWGFD